MAREPAPRPGTVCWVDLLSSDPARSIAFYAALFRWGVRGAADAASGYVTLEADGRPLAGLAPNIPESGIPDTWTAYLACDDLEGAESAVTVAGGTVAVQALAVGPSAALSIVTDPGGAVVGLWDSLRHSGFGSPGRSAAPVWYELVTTEYDAALGFYRQVAGWSYRPLDAGSVGNGSVRYSLCLRGTATVAGVREEAVGRAAGTPSHWQVFFGVDDVDATLDSVAALGGTVLQPARDTALDRRAMVADPTGARFLVASVLAG